VQDFVGHGQIAAAAVWLVAGKADIVLGKAGQKLFIRHQRVQEHAIAPTLRRVRSDPFVHARRGAPA
jgi:hypothetical protein